METPLSVSYFPLPPPQEQTLYSNLSSLNVFKVI